MVTMDPDRARAYLRSTMEHKRLADEYSDFADRSGLPDVVYYIQFRDVIKIGTTVDLEHRLESLPWEVLLGLEPGSIRTERHRHKQFRHLRFMDEWFHDHPALRAHIQQVNDRNAPWLSEDYPEMAFPYEYRSRHKHTYR